jgi:hypothetical protein
MTIMPQAFLTVREPGRPVQVYAIHERGVAIGRDARNGIALSDAQVSRAHLQILPQNSVYYVVDMQSRTGTWLNDRHVQAPTYLRDGDRIKVGNTVLEYGLGRPVGQGLSGVLGPLLGSADGMLRAVPAQWAPALGFASGALFMLAAFLPWLRLPLLGAFPTPSLVVAVSLLAGMATLVLTHMGDRGLGRQYMGAAAAVGIVLFWLGVGLRCKQLVGIDVVSPGSGVLVATVAAVLALISGRVALMSR